MAQSPEDRLAQLVRQLEQNPGLAAQLPPTEGAIVQAALAGQPVYAIAQDQGMSDEAVWAALSNAARAAAGHAPQQSAETEGLSSDSAAGASDE